MSYDANGRNWIPARFQEAARLIAIDAAQKFTKPQQIIGLGSGPMVAAIVKELVNLPYKDSLECIATSFQIKLEAESFGTEGLRLVDANHIPMIDVVFDGADQIDSKYNMIKGAGGALLREKVLHSAAKKLVITAESTKFVKYLDYPVPIEVNPFGRHITESKIKKIGGQVKLRMLKEGYPYITENGNLVYDTTFALISDIQKTEANLKSIPGVLEVGLFTKHADVYYKASAYGSFEFIEPKKK